MLFLFICSAVLLTHTQALYGGECKHATRDGCKRDGQEDCVWEMEACKRRPPCRTHACVEGVLGIYLDQDRFCVNYPDFMWKDGKCQPKAIAECETHTTDTTCYGGIPIGEDCDWTGGVCHLRKHCLDDKCCETFSDWEESLCGWKIENYSPLWECEWRNGGCKTRRCVGHFTAEKCNNSPDSCSWSKGVCIPQAVVTEPPTAPPTAPPTIPQPPTSYDECKQGYSGTCKNDCDCACGKDKCFDMVWGEKCYSCNDLGLKSDCEDRGGCVYDGTKGYGKRCFDAPGTAPTTCPPIPVVTCDGFKRRKCWKREGCKLEGETCVEGLHLTRKVCKQALKEGGQAGCEAIGCKYKEKVKRNNIRKRCKLQ